MKKILALAVLTVLVPSFLSANPFADEKLNKEVAEKIETAVSTHTAPPEADIAKLKTELRKALEYFTKFAKNRAYYEYDYMFQSLDSVRLSYMNLREASPEAAVEMVEEVNKPISIDNGKRSIQIYNYVNMESVVMASRSAREGELWEEWTVALSEDLQKASKKGDKQTADQKKASEGVTGETPLAEGLPKYFASSVQNLRAYIGNSKVFNRSYVLQSMMTPMDEFNANLEKNPALGPLMAKEFVKPIKAGWGGVLNPVEFIRNNSGMTSSSQLEAELDEFLANLVRLSK